MGTYPQNGNLIFLGQMEHKEIFETSLLEYINQPDEINKVSDDNSSSEEISADEYTSLIFHRRMRELEKKIKPKSFFAAVIFPGTISALISLLAAHTLHSTHLIVISLLFIFLYYIIKDIIVCSVIVNEVSQEDISELKRLCLDFGDEADFKTIDKCQRVIRNSSISASS